MGLFIKTFYYAILNKKKKGSIALSKSLSIFIKCYFYIIFLFYLLFMSVNNKKILLAKIIYEKNKQRHSFIKRQINSCFCKSSSIIYDLYGCIIKKLY